MKNRKLTIQGIIKIMGLNIAVLNGKTWFVRKVRTDDDWYEFVCSDTQTEIPIRLLRYSKGRSGWDWDRADKTTSYVTEGYIGDMQNAINSLEIELKHILN